EAVMIGGEASFGAHRQQHETRELICKLVVDHPDRQGAELFAREQWAGISGMSVGTSINLATHVQPMTGTFLFLLNKQAVTSRMTLGGVTLDVPVAMGVPEARCASLSSQPKPGPEPKTGEVAVELVRLAWARSGDKGHLFNIAIIARSPEYLSYLRAALTPEAVGEWYRHLRPDGLPPHVDRYDVPGFNALNFVLHDCLAGGINASTQLDPAAKGMAQMLLRFPVPVCVALQAKFAKPNQSHVGD
ncbi:MAG: DUF1446 domain-containing protein, partial [Sphingorhabdus sp.]